nr:GNAT family N-acetyltransferase [Microbacterium humi]
MVRLRNLIESQSAGTTELEPSAELLLQRWNNQQFDPQRMFLARVGREVIGRALYMWPAEADGAHIAELSVEVHPDWRSRGIGSALLQTIEGEARRDGRRVLECWAMHGPPAGSLTPPTGFGRVDESRPEVRFLLANEYTLEQVERISRLALPASGLEDMRADAAGHATGYRIVQWVGAVPDEWVADAAALHERMATDAPSAGIDVGEEQWSAERLRAYREQYERAGERLVSTAAVHEASGRLVGYSDLAVPLDTDRAATQEDTLVLVEHRGHRLGMLLKIANLLQLEELSPRTAAVATFNAEENRPMLSVNEAIGFTPIGTEGAWKKPLSAPSGSSDSGATSGS